MATDDNGAGIAIWGPTGSGKDWLIRGFAKELQHFNREHPDFTFELYDEDDNPVMPVPPSKAVIQGTLDPEDFVFKFVRRPTSQNPDHAHQISTHAHQINIHNDAGANLLAILVDPKGYEDTFQTMMDSQYVIVVLDPTYISRKATQLDIKAEYKQRKEMDVEESDPDDYDMEDDNDKPELARKSKFTREEYAQIIHYLLMALSKNSPKKRYLAVCLTKMDKKKIRGNAWSLLKRMFGQEMHDLLLTHKRVFEIEVFATSAVGFVKDKKDNMGVKVSNEVDGDIKDTSQWQPINTAAPFFWIFENKEKEKIKASDGTFSNNLKDYIEYPSRSL